MTDQSKLPAGFDPAKPLHNRRRESFCNELTVKAPPNCLSAVQIGELVPREDIAAAFEAAGLKRPRGNTDRMLREPDVAARLDWLLARTAGAVPA